MKKLIILLSLFLLMFAFASCNGNNENNNNYIDNNDNENQIENNNNVNNDNNEENNNENDDMDNENNTGNNNEDNSVDNENNNDTNNQDNTQNDDDEENQTSDEKVKDYFPFLDDVKLVYEGEGNEYASYTLMTDYYDKELNRIQVREDNSGTVMAKVYEIKDGEIYTVYTRAEFYYRDNLLRKENSKEDKNILLKEPLVKGNKWTLPDNGKREITDVNVKIVTDLGTYNTIEVTTEYDESGNKSKSYYAKDVGLIKSVYDGDDYQVSSTLSKIEEESPYTRTIDIYYPNEEGGMYATDYKLVFHTNSISRKVIEEALKHETEGHPSLISQNTNVNTLYLGDDEIIYIDLSEDYIDDMNLGSSYESLYLKCITNTLGRYYGSNKVYLTIDGENYEGGHIALEKGELLTVDYD